jgi:hypothetical protein
VVAARKEAKPAVQKEVSLGVGWAAGGVEAALGAETKGEGLVVRLAGRLEDTQGVGRLAGGGAEN